MSLAQCQIQIYDTDDVWVDTVDHNIIECQFNDILTSGVGSFRFTMAGQKGFAYISTDIGNNYKAKIWLGYDGSLTHLFTGKILPFTTNMGASAVKVFEGKSLGEILERRQKTNKRWQSVAANAIVAEIASDLSLSSDIVADTTAETITVRTETYFDVLKKVSDYWYSAGTQVKKDFYVDKDNVLIWKARPLRTAGVETFTYGEDFLTYNLKYDILGVKNKITVYGAPTAYLPRDRDAYTDSLTNWTATYGTLQLSTSKKLGTYSIGCQGPGGASPNYDMLFQRTIPRVTIRHVNTVRFWHQFLVQPSTAYFRLFAPDASNYFQTDLDWGLGWHFNDFALGPNQVYDEYANPNGIWTEVGSPNWWDIQGIQFYRNGADTSDDWTLIDAFHFYPDRWLSDPPVEDATSQTAYEIREAEFTDENLSSDTDCEKRAKTLLYQLKDRVLRLDFTVKGNANVLKGDRLTLTLPPDNITDIPFDVVSVEQHYSSAPRGWQTTAHLVDSANVRQLPPVTPLDSVARQMAATKEVVAEIYSRVVR